MEGTSSCSDVALQSFEGNDQVCHCGAANCRGYITSKSKVKVEKTKVLSSKKKRKTKKSASKSEEQRDLRLTAEELAKPMSKKQRAFVLKHHVILLRNLTEGRQAVRMDIENEVIAMQELQEELEDEEAAAAKAEIGAFKLRMAALKSGARAVRTRTLAAANDEKLEATVQLALFAEPILNEVLAMRRQSLYIFPAFALTY